LAAAGLATVMILAAVWHASRAEYPQIGAKIFVAAIMIFMGFGRWRMRPIVAEPTG
jgi:hypothetical protein